jgi:hypothetical protein
LSHCEELSEKILRSQKDIIPKVHELFIATSRHPGNLPLGYFMDPPNTLMEYHNLTTEDQPVIIEVRAPHRDQMVSVDFEENFRTVRISERTLVGDLLERICKEVGIAFPFNFRLCFITEKKSSYKLADQSICNILKLISFPPPF